MEKLGLQFSRKSRLNAVVDSPHVQNHIHQYQASLQPGAALTTHPNLGEVHDAALRFPASFSRVAPELWVEIFLYYLPVFEAASRQFFFEYEQHLLVISSVCGHWNAIALSTPRLWCLIEYCSTSSSDILQKANQSNRVGTWISRSRSCPLTIMLTVGPGNSGNSDPVLRNLILLSRRWEFLHVSADCERSVCKVLSPIVSGNLPLLRQAYINVPLLGNEIDPSLNFACTLRQAPQLTSIHLSRIDPLALHLLFDLPLVQLKALTLPSLTSSKAFFCVLSRLPNVEELRISVDAGPVAFLSPDHPMPELPFSHMNLRLFSLDIAVRGDDLIIQHLQRETSHILNNLDLPRLSDFSMACGETHWPCKGALFSLFKRNGGSLEALKVVQKEEKVVQSGRGDLSAQLRDLLLLVPRLKVLELQLSQKSLYQVLCILYSRDDTRSLVPPGRRILFNTGLEKDGYALEGLVEAISEFGQCRGYQVEQTNPGIFTISTY